MGKFYEAASDELSLHVKQLAWLHAYPKDRKGERAKKSRLEASKDADAEIILPHCPAPYLIEWLFEIGPGGDEPVGYRDFAAWQSLSGVKLTPWEAKTLRRMAQDYLSMAIKASEADCAPPYTGLDDKREAARDAVAKKVDALFAKPKRAS